MCHFTSFAMLQIVQNGVVLVIGSFKSTFAQHETNHSLNISPFSQPCMSVKWIYPNINVSPLHPYHRWWSGRWHGTWSYWAWRPGSRRSKCGYSIFRHAISPFPWAVNSWAVFNLSMHLAIRGEQMFCYSYEGLASVLRPVFTVYTVLLFGQITNFFTLS